MNEKPWYWSKMMWVNIFTMLVGILGAIAGQEYIKEYPQVAAGLATAIAVLNVILRSITNKAVTFLRN